MNIEKLKTGTKMKKTITKRSETYKMIWLGTD